jgi:hypothetical protein
VGVKLELNVASTWVKAEVETMAFRCRTPLSHSPQSNPLIMIRCICLLFALTVVAFAEVKYNGIISVQGKTYFCLAAGTNKATWLGVGELIDGYTIVDFSLKEDTLTLDKEGKRSVIAMEQATTQKGNANPNEEFVVEQLSQKMSNLPKPNRIAAEWAIKRYRDLIKDEEAILKKGQTPGAKGSGPTTEEQKALDEIRTKKLSFLDKIAQINQAD